MVRSSGRTIWALEAGTLTSDQSTWTLVSSEEYVERAPLRKHEP